MNDVTESPPTRRHGSLRLRLAAAVSAAVVVVIFASTVIDYTLEYRQGLHNVRASLEEQAHAIRLARHRLGSGREFADYVDEFCAKMNESISPGHHILVLDKTGAVAASSRYHSGAEMERALKAADGQAPVVAVGPHRAAQFRLRDDDGSTIVIAQYLDHIQRLLRWRLIGRLVTAACAAGLLILLVFGTISRWVLQPVARLKRAASAWTKRDFSTRAEPAGPDDLRALTRQFNVMASELERHEQDRLAEMVKARTIQANLLPKALPQVRGLELAAAYRPAEHVAGDLYDVFELSDGRLAVGVIDVAGHGVSAALLTGVVKMSLHHRVVQEADLAKAVSTVNADLLRCLPVGEFVTLCLGTYQADRRTWTYCAAGHPGGMVRRAAHVEHLQATGPLLGVLETSGSWTTRSVVLEPGDIILLYSDGAIEAGRPGAKLGQDGLERLLLSFQGPIKRLPEVVMSEVERRESATPQDDVTVLALRAVS